MGVFEMRNFRRPHPRYPKTLWRASLAQRYARLKRHAKTQHFFGIARCKHPHPRYTKTLWRAYLVQRYARLNRHAKTRHFLALRISNTSILGIRKQFCGQIWCRGMHAWSAAPKAHVFWHCAFQTPRTRYPKTLFLADLEQRYAHLERHAKPPHF